MSKEFAAVVMTMTICLSVLILALAIIYATYRSHQNDRQAVEMERLRAHEVRMQELKNREWDLLSKSMKEIVKPEVVGAESRAVEAHPFGRSA